MHNWARSKRQSVLTLKHYTHTNVSTGRYSDCVNGGQRGTACLANYSKLRCNTSGNAGQLPPFTPACLPLNLTPVLPEAINVGSVAGIFLLLPTEHSALQMPKQGISAILTCLFSPVCDTISYTTVSHFPHGHLTLAQDGQHSLNEQLFIFALLSLSQ